ncbi:hypothetical protein NDU88_002327, partial [Pleurodeles waltl]
HEVLNFGGDCQRFLAFLPNSTFSGHSGISSWRPECHSRLELQVPIRFQRLDVGPSDFCPDSSGMGQLRSGPICLSPQLPNSKILQLASRPLCSKDRCFSAGLVPVSRLCVSSVSDDCQGPGSSAETENR